MNYRKKFVEERIYNLKRKRDIPSSFLLAGILSPLLMISNGFKVSYIVMSIVLILLGYSSLVSVNKEIREFIKKNG